MKLIYIVFFLATSCSSNNDKDIPAKNNLFKLEVPVQKKIMQNKNVVYPDSLILIKINSSISINWNRNKKTIEKNNLFYKLNLK